jgi:hypothetical protein
MTTLFVNLFGPPGAGKSTIRAKVFYNLKMAGVNVEEVPEVAKDMVWEKRQMALNCQPYVFAKQLRNMERLIGQVDCIVTDSPVLLSSFYDQWYMLGEPASFHTYVKEKFWRMRPFINVFIDRVKPYNAAGRLQTEQESIAVGRAQRDWLARNDIPHFMLSGNEEAGDIISEEVRAALAPRMTEEELLRGLEHLLPPSERFKT